MSLVFMIGSVGPKYPGRVNGDPGNWLNMPDDLMRREGEDRSPHLPDHITIGRLLSNTAGFLRVTAFVKTGTLILCFSRRVANQVGFVDKTILIGYKRDRSPKER
jgi:hypothetical protein